jgi:hypothetical protein
MLTTVEGIYRNGKVELAEIPANVDDDTPVIVTFLSARYVDLDTRGIGRRRALELRERLSSFSEDWDSPEMEDYDRYDELKSGI